MRENKNAAIHIGQLNLRMPGNSADTAYRVANGIGQSLAQKVPAGIERRLGALSIRVQVPAGATEAEMSEAVSSAIVKALRQAEAKR
jgi:hypothetical protein